MSVNPRLLFTCMCYLFKNIFESMSAGRACEVIFDCSLL